MKAFVRNLLIVMGGVFLAMLVWSLARPVLNRFAVVASYGDHSPAEFFRSYSLRLFLPLLLYVGAGFGIASLIESHRRVLWASFTIFIGTVVSLLFWSDTLTGRVPFSIPVETLLPSLVPLLGLLIGSLVGLCIVRRSPPTI